MFVILILYSIVIFAPCIISSSIYIDTGTPFLLAPITFLLTPFCVSIKTVPSDNVTFIVCISLSNVSSTLGLSRNAKFICSILLAPILFA